MEDNNTEDSELASTISDIQDKVNKFSEEITQISHDEFIESDRFEQFNSAVIDYKQYSESTSDLAKFWLSYLSMAELLLNTLYATRIGDWDLLLECVRDIARYAFAYDNYNNARYLTPWLSDMINLETSHPDVYHEFKRGNFSVQLSETNPFGRCEPDKAIETTINKDTKTPGGLTGFSTKTNAVDQWTINASYRASLYSHLQEFLGANTKKYVHADLQKSRIRKDQDDITSMLSIIEKCFIDPFSENPLLSISNGMSAAEKLVLDTFNDFKLGTERMDTFIEERCIEKSKDFFDPLKTINIETFSKLSKCVTYKCKDKDIPLVANRNLFAKLIIIMQKRSIDLKEVFKYPLGPFPWALAGSVGGLKN